MTFRGGDAGVSCYGISSPPVARGGHQGPLRYCRLGSCPSTPLAERPRPSHRRWRARNCFGLHASRQVEDVSRSCPACRLRARRTLSKRYVIDARLATRRRHLRARRRGWIFLEKQNAAALTSLAECRFPASAGLLKSANFVAGTLLMFCGGLIMTGTLALLPTMLQNLMNYPALTTGLVTAPRGIGSMAAMFLVAPSMARRCSARATSRKRKSRP